MVLFTGEPLGSVQSIAWRMPPLSSGSTTIASAIARCRPSVMIATRIAVVASSAMNETP